MPSTIGPSIAPAASLVRSLAEMMLKGVTADTAARFAAPGGVKVISNHPVFVFGHLATYNRRVLVLCNKPEGVAAYPAEWDGLFKAGVECKDDAAGTIYPSLETVTRKFFEGFDAAVAAIKTVDDSVLLEPNPAEGRMKELFPLRGQLMPFLLAAHPMSHLGQVSAWRRMVGLGSAM